VVLAEERTLDVGAPLSVDSGPVRKVGYHGPMGAHSSYQSISAAAMLMICCCLAKPAPAQMPFYTDDPSITPIKTIHICWRALKTDQETGFLLTEN
jgi:hypothetical protein